MAIYFSWRSPTSLDIANWKAQRFTYTWKYNTNDHGKKVLKERESDTAFWVFNESAAYKPDANITHQRVLIAFDFSNGVQIIEDRARQINFESDTFEGESKHPDKVIVKHNEPGAFGIGKNVRALLKVTKIRLATNPEVAKSLGLGKKAPVPTQYW
jgi:hypothetical protein